MCVNGLIAQMNDSLVWPGHLSVWGRQSFFNVRQELKNLNEELERLRAEPTRVGPSHAEIKIVDRIVELSYRCGSRG